MCVCLRFRRSEQYTKFSSSRTRILFCYARESSNSSNCTWSNCVESRFLEPTDNSNQKSFPLLSQTL